VYGRENIIKTQRPEVQLFSFLWLTFFKTICKKNNPTIGKLSTDQRVFGAILNYE
jgi:hypothetical protein